jgi:hypothetical protein
MAIDVQAGCLQLRMCACCADRLIVVKAMVLLLGVWCAVATLKSSMQGRGLQQKLCPTVVAKQQAANSSHHWEPFFRGANVLHIPQADRGGLLKYCFDSLNSTVLGQEQSSIGHTAYEHEMAVPVTTLAQLQQAQTLMNACLVREERIHTEQHIDPPMSASAEVCSQTDLLERLFTRRMMLDRGMNITKLCGEQAISTWCNKNAANMARCQAYQTHPIPQDVPVMAAFTNTHITSLGDVFVKDYVFKPVGPCIAQLQAQQPVGDVPRYHEVVVATAVYGGAVYHALIENLPRLMIVWDVSCAISCHCRVHT